ncbi:hypothetical protein ACLK1T_29085 [Escherichia coli]
MDVDPNASLSCEEIFGPVLVVTRSHQKNRRYSLPIIARRPWRGGMGRATSPARTV